MEALAANNISCLEHIGSATVDDLAFEAKFSVGVVCIVGCMC